MDPSKIVEQEPLTWKFWKKKRYIVVLLAFIGFFNVYTLRVNLSVAIVAMTEIHSVTDENGKETFEQEFPWDSKQKGLILSSFFYGYIMTQFLGGILSSKIGGNHVFGIGIAATAILTLVTPLAAKHSNHMLITVRIIEGIFEGVTYPCIHAVWARWAPPLERSRMATLAFAGTYVGSLVTFPASGLIAHYFGWEYIFYIFGSIAIVWVVIWIIVVRAGPEDDRFCSPEEVLYIVESLGGQRRKGNVKHPWKSIFTSKPVYAITASHFAENWGFYTLLTLLPTFLKDTLHMDLDKTGYVSALPYIFKGLFIGISGYLADCFQVKGYLTTTQVRKYFNCIAFLIQTIFMVLAGFVQDTIGSVICITSAVAVGAFAWSGFGINHLDLGSQHASVLMGITNTFGTVPGIVSPTLAGFIVQNMLFEEWRIVFFISAGISFFGGFVYWFWASGEVQDWAKTTEDIGPELKQNDKK